MIVPIVPLVLLAGALGWYRSGQRSNTDQPPGEPGAPTQARTRSDTNHIAWAEPIADEHVLRGNYVFEQNCAVCHGRRGDGRGDMAEGMRPKPRKLTLGIFKFRSTPTGTLPTDADLERTILRGIANSSMPTFAHLPARDVTALVAFLKTLSPRWRERQNIAPALVLPTEPSWLYDETARRPHQEAGRTLFAQQCAVCHGVAGDGKSELAAQLQDISEEPCPPADLTQPAFKAGAEPSEVFRVLATGLDGTPMPSFRDGLKDESLWDLVAYVRSLRP